jgi:glycosyltransferase involved in cell wall biosynthesis
LWFAGSGPHRCQRQLAQLTNRLGLDTAVRWLGRVADADLPGLYARAIAVVVPSLHEGFGIPVLEAMAAGANVLASNTSALPEVGGAAACLLPPHDPNAWSRALAEICSATAATTQRRDAGITWARRFHWPTLAAAEAEVWRRCAGPGR